MSLAPNLTEQELLVESRQRADQRFVSHELACELALAAAFLAAVAALWLAHPPGSFDVAPALLCFGVLILATKVRFETPFGFTVATQLAFVPLLFALPGALVPIVCAAALALARIPQVISGRVPPERLLRVLPNSWFAIGPVAVFTIAGVSPAAAGPALLIAALAAQIAVDVIISAARTTIERGADLSTQLGEWWIYAIDVALAVTGLVVAEEIGSQPIVALAPLPLLGLLAVFARERTQRIESLIELGTAYRGTALVLGDVIEADDGYTGEHCKSVVRLAIDLAAGLGLDAEARRNVEFAALLHDVGKIAIPKEIINKPDKLTPDEWRVIETHTVEGQKLLDRIGGFMQRVGSIVRSHHERWDGAGYPDGLAGEVIPIEARIITACDSWNAMRTDRPYRKAMSYAAACDELKMGAGAQFDPHVVKVLLALLDQTEGAAERAARLAAATSRAALSSRELEAAKPQGVRPEPAPDRPPLGGLAPA